MFDDIHFNYSTFKLANPSKINKQTHSEFAALKKSTEIKRTHLFNGRYENIYVDRNSISTLDEILHYVCKCAQQVLEITQPLDVGFWFNDMPPGSVTTAHTHDDDDELLSGVYYIKVPLESGDLILSNNGEKKIITPKEGQIILFRPDCLHEVTENKTEEYRLSIGMNFGIRNNDN